MSRDDNQRERLARIERRVRAALAVLGVALVALNAYLIARLVSDLQQARQAEPPGLTALEARPQAEEALEAIMRERGLEKSPPLKDATATWQLPGDEAAMRAGRGEWQFDYLASEVGEVWIFTVNQDGAWLSLRQTLSREPYQLVPIAWRLDSPEAIQVALVAGGQAFIEARPETRVTLRLTTEAAEGFVLWKATFEASDGSTRTFEVDAASGEVRSVR
jgi:hypothetical protein